MVVFKVLHNSRLRHLYSATYGILYPPAVGQLYSAAFGILPLLVFFAAHAADSMNAFAIMVRSGQVYYSDSESAEV